jgi:PAS domain S-box-containing protein
MFTNNANSDLQRIQPAQISRLLGFAVFWLGVIVLLGWLFNIPLLTRIYPTLASMKFNTALLFTLAGLAVFTLPADKPYKKILTWTMVLVAGLTLAEYLFGWNLGIDEFFAADTLRQSAAPGRMSVISAINFMLIAVSLIGLPKQPRLSQICAYLVGVSALIVLAGYFYNVPALYNVFIFSSVALHTAIAFLLIATALIFANTNSYFMRILSSDSAGARLMREVLPVTILLLTAMDTLFVLGEKAGLYQHEFIMPLNVIASLITVIIVISSIANQWHKTDLQRIAAEEQLRQSYEQLEQLIQERTRDLVDVNVALQQSQLRFARVLETAHDAIISIDDHERIVMFNQGAEFIFGYSHTEIIGQPLWLLIPEHFRTVHNQHIAAFAAASSRSRVMAHDRPELAGRHKDGREFFIEASISRLELDGENIFTAVIRDISRQKAAHAAVILKIQEERELQHYLKLLQELIVELTNVDELDEFYRRAVELGLQKFEFERLGFLLYDAKADVAVGTYGTNREGKLTPEHHLRFDPAELTSVLLRVLQQAERFVLVEEAELFDNFEPIGTGLNAVSILWNGTEKLGWLAIDNGVHHKPISKAQLEILALYALNLGNLLGQKRILNMLRENEQKLQTLFEVLPVGVSLLNQERQIVQVNPALEQILDMMLPDLLEGKYGNRRYIHADGSPIQPEDFPSERAIREQKPIFDVEMGVVKENGETIWTLVNAAPLSIADLSAVVVSRDITERKRLEDETRIYKAAVESSSELISVVDDEYLYVIVNDTYLQYNQRECHEIIGQHVREIVGEEQFNKSLKRKIDLCFAGQSLTIESSVDYPLLGLRHLLISYSPLHDAVNQVIGVVIIAHDITERKEAEQALAASREYLSILTHGLADGIVTVNIYDRTMRFMNQKMCEIFGYAEEELIGRSTRMFYPDDESYITFSNAMQSAIASRQLPFLAERELVRKNGHRFWASTATSTLTVNGEVAEVIAIVRDITERKQAEMQARQLEIERERVNILRDFIHSASHDLKTPITQIVTSLYLLKRTATTDDQQNRIVKLEAHAKHLSNIVQSLLQLTEIDEKADFEIARIDVRTILEELMGSYTTLVQHKNQQLTLDCAENTLFINADRQYLNQALHRLMDNAVTYTPDGGSIMLSVYQQSDEHVIQIKDTGMGIDEQDLPRIFERFYRADKARTIGEGHTGIGLAIARKIIEAHHGRIEVTSQLNVGSTFCVFLPTADNDVSES